MSKKLYSLAVLAAVVGCMAVPAASQALTPRWYISGSIIPAGEANAVPVISWGTLTLSGAGSPIKCQNIVLGDVENPTAGTAGVGRTYQFSTYNCENTECPGAGVGPGGTPTGVEIAVTAEEHNPWLENLKAVTPASTTSVVNTETTGIWVNIACVKASVSYPFEHEKEPIQSFPTTTNTEILWPVPKIVAGPFVCFGSSLGKDKTGSGTFSETPSKLELPTTGSPTLTCPGVGTGITTGKLKTMGYNGNELIEASNRL